MRISLAKQNLFGGFLWISLLVFAPLTAQAQTEARNPTKTNAGQISQVQDKVEDFYQLYQKQLESVLKTRLQEEQTFVRQVVDMVRNEQLPKVLVDRAWLWVRANRAYTGYPFVYFERVLRLEAEKLKIELPPFDRSIYSQARRNSVTRKRR